MYSGTFRTQVRRHGDRWMWYTLILAAGVMGVIAVIRDINICAC